MTIFKNFRQFRGFALHYEFAESAESSQNVVLLPDKRLDYFLTELKLGPDVKNSRKLNQTSKRGYVGSPDTRIKRNWLTLVALSLRHPLLVI